MPEADLKTDEDLDDVPENQDEIADQDEAAEDEGGDTLAGGDEGAKEEDDGELSIVIGDDDPEDDVDESQLSDSGKRALHRLREMAKEKAREARELKARLDAVESDTKPKDRPKEPTLEECGYNDAEYAKRMKEYLKAEAEAEAEEKTRRAAQEADEADYRGRIERYTEARKSLKVRDFDAAEDVVRAALSKQQQSILIRNLEDPAKVIYALGTSKKALAELAAVKDHDRFAYRLAKLEGEIKVTQKAPPEPESKIGKGSSSAAAMPSQRLADAEKEARRTGDYTEVFKLRRASR